MNFLINCLIFSLSAAASLIPHPSNCIPAQSSLSLPPSLSHSLPASLPLSCHNSQTQQLPRQQDPRNRPHAVTHAHTYVVLQMTLRVAITNSSASPEERKRREMDGGTEGRTDECVKGRDSTADDAMMIINICGGGGNSTSISSCFYWKRLEREHPCRWICL